MFLANFHGYTFIVILEYCSKGALLIRPFTNSLQADRLLVDRIYKLYLYAAWYHYFTDIYKTDNVTGFWALIYFIFYSLIVMYIVSKEEE